MAFVEVKTIVSSDVDLDTFLLPNSGDFGIWLELEIGEQGGKSADIFQLFVCTPGWLRKKILDDGPVWQHGIMILDGPDLSNIVGHVNKALARLGDAEWNVTVKKLRLLAKWEFEDYQPHRVE